MASLDVVTFNSNLSANLVDRCHQLDDSGLYKVFYSSGDADDLDNPGNKLFTLI